MRTVGHTTWTRTQYIQNTNHCIITLGDSYLSSSSSSSLIEWDLLLISTSRLIRTWFNCTYRMEGTNGCRTSLQFMYTANRCVALIDRAQVLCGIAIRAHAEKARGYLGNVTADWCVLELRTRCPTKKEKVRKYMHSINILTCSLSYCVSTA
jgi:hypothetical protein